MNKPLMFVNNNFIVEQLKTAVWENIKKLEVVTLKGGTII